MKKSDYLPVGTQVLYKGEPGWEILVVEPFMTGCYHIINYELQERIEVVQSEITRAPVTLDTLIEGDVIVSAGNDFYLEVNGRIGDVYIMSADESILDDEDMEFMYHLIELKKQGWKVSEPTSAPEKITMTRAEVKEALKIKGELEITD